MLRFLYIGDFHYSETAPYFRIDDYEETRRQKLQEIKDYVKTHRVEAILEGGDFFDHPKISAECLSSIFTEWEKNMRLVPNSFGAIPLIGIEGNHELIGSQIDSYDKTSLHLLEACGFLQIASKHNPIIFKDKSGFTVAITGSPYDKDSDKTDNKDAYIIKQKSGDVHIHLTHGLIMNKSFGKKFAHTTIHELAPYTEADLTINGHDHIGFPTEQINGKWFANPGAPMRMKAENNELNRVPKFLVIEVHDDLSVHLEDVYFKCAKAGNDVLSTDHLILKKHKTNHLAKIQALVNQAETKTGLYIADIIDNIGNTKGINQDVLNTAKAEIVAAMDAMEVPYKPEGQYYVQRVDLENFLSHKNSSFEFTEGLNILSGESRSGKSAVLRAITEVFQCNLVQPRDAITFNEDYFKITLTLSNGYIITRKVERKPSGFNGYEIYNPKTGNVEEYNTKALPMVQELLGMREIHLTDKDKDNVNINFLSQEEGWFFLNMTGPNRAKILGVIYGTNYADMAVKNYNSNIKKKNAEISTHKKDLEKYTEEQKKYEKLPELEQIITEAEAKMTLLAEMSQKIQKAEELIASINAFKKQIEKLEFTIQKLSINLDDKYQELLAKYQQVAMAQKTLAELQQTVKDGQNARILQKTLTPLKNITLADLKKKEDELKVFKQKYELLVKLRETLTENKSKIELTKRQIAQLQNLQNWEAHYKTLQQLSEQLKAQTENTQKAKALYQEMKVILNEGKAKRKIVDALTAAVSQAQTVEHLKKQQEAIAKGKVIVQDVRQLQTQAETMSKTIQEQNKTLTSQKQQYRKKLTETNSCPICHTPIDQDTIEKIVKDL